MTSPMVEMSVDRGPARLSRAPAPAHAGLFYNFAPGSGCPAKRALDAYTNFFASSSGVFSVDVVNFLVLVHHQPRAGGVSTIISRYGWGGGPATRTSASPSRSPACSRRSSTIRATRRCSGSACCATRGRCRARPGSVLVFEYVSIGKTARAFEHVPVAEFVVDVTAATVAERVSNAAFRTAPHAVSPVYEGCARHLRPRRAERAASPAAGPWRRANGEAPCSPRLSIAVSDDEHVVAGPDPALGARRLSIVDVVKGGSPSPTRPTVWAAQNGERG